MAGGASQVAGSARPKTRPRGVFVRSDGGFLPHAETLRNTDTKRVPLTTLADRFFP